VVRRVLLAALLQLSAARPYDAQFCGASQNYTVLGTSGVFGCQGYGNNVNVWFNASDPNPRMLTFLSFSTETCCDFLTIYYGAITYGPFSGQNNPGAFFFGGGDILVNFRSDPSNTYPGFTIQVTTTPPMDNLKSQQPFTKSINAGGMSYFALPQTFSGSSLTVSLSVTSFDGLQSPTLFMSKNRLPSLEGYDYINNTIASGSRYVASFNVNNPPAGQYWLGVFLYGNVAQINLVANWAYNFPPLLNGVKNTTSVGATGITFQLYTPKATRSLVLAISRQIPGGFPVAYVAQGYVPTASQYGWVMDTTVKSYISLTINTPNPTVNYNANPGTYFITIVASDGPTDSAVVPVEPAAVKAQRSIETLSAEGVSKEAVLDKIAKQEEQEALALTAGFIFMAQWS